MIFLICTLKYRDPIKLLYAYFCIVDFFLIVRLYERQHGDAVTDGTAVPLDNILVSSTLVMTKLFLNATAK